MRFLHRNLGFQSKGQVGTCSASAPTIAKLNRTTCEIAGRPSSRAEWDGSTVQPAKSFQVAANMTDLCFQQRKQQLHHTQNPSNIQATWTLQILSPLSHLITPSRLSVPNSKFLRCPQKCLYATSDACITTQMKFAASRTKGTAPIQRES